MYYSHCARRAESINFCHRRITALNDDIKMPAFVPDSIRTFQPSLGTPEALYPVAIRLFIYMDIHTYPARHTTHAHLACHSLAPLKLRSLACEVSRTSYRLLLSPIISLLNWAGTGYGT